MAETKSTAKKKLGIGRHKSAQKRARQTIKRTERNLTVRSTMRTYIKQVRLALEKKDKSAAQKSLQVALPYIAKAVSKGVIHKGTAARYASRLTQACNNLN